MADEAQTSTAEGKKAPVIAGFELLARVGRGGMGTVYRARQISVDRIVAVKILKPSLARSTSFIRRFREEAKAAAQLNHPNIVQAIDAGEDGGYYYFTMEFVDGETLHQRMLREGILDEALALRMTADVAQALSHAFTHGIVHRDIKPGNIMISRKGQTKLCDLGLARVLADEEASTERGAAVGTPYYMSPEQARGIINVDIRSDIYSLGATLFRAVAGRPAFNAPTSSEILEQHVHAPLPWPKDCNPELSNDICFAIAKMMAKKPEERYQTPQELAEDIERILSGAGLESRLIQFETPPHRLTSEEMAAEAMTRARLAKKRQAVRQLADVRAVIDRVCKEQSIPPHAVVRLLHGNLDESRPDTFLKYGVLLLAEQKFAQARREFRRAQALGADVSPFMGKLDALGAPPGMVYVPGGEFLSGPPDEQTTRKIAPFYLDENVVTNRKYYDFIRATGAAAPPHWVEGAIPEGQDDFPVVDITWDEAEAFARWTQKRLPTAAEYEMAARGHNGLRYPWGNDFDPLRCNVQESGHGQLTVAGRYPRGRSPYGCYDLFGNTSAWCADAGPAGAAEDRAVYGVSFVDSGASCGAWRVRFRDRQRRSRRTGFRCALDL